MRRVFIWTIRVVIAVVAIPPLLGAGFIGSFIRSVPVYDGAVTAPGLLAPVQILRDNYAVPHIMAGSLEDAAFGLGYAHAQDRLWQMEMTRRFVQGRLAELFGATAVRTDIMMRTLGLYPAAQAAVSHLSPESQRTLTAYAAGVNAYLANHKGPLPIEFTLAGDTPEPWTPADSISVLKGMALQLSGNMYTELARARLIPVLGRQGVESFFPPFDAAPLPSYLDEAYGATQTGQASAIPDTTASDNWAVDGKHSDTGKPLLANDPHLGFTIPSVWYLAHLSFGGEDIVGGTLAGLPAIVAGRNRHLAWGETNTGPDTQDLYLERLSPDNRNEYQTPAGFAAFDARVETIKVRFGHDQRIIIRSSRHGPVMSDIAGGPFAAAAPKGYVLALSWTALSEDDTTFDAIIGIDRAKTIVEAQKAAIPLVAPMQNIVMADDDGDAGHIGLMLPGRVPLRSDKNDSLGLVPEPGWDGRYDWQGYIPADAIFTLTDPSSGHIVTANNKTVPDNYPYTLTHEWESNYRHDRIDTLLAATSIQSTAGFAAIQTDIADSYALQLVRRLSTAGPFSNTAVKAADLLRAWDGRMDRDRPEPLIFAAFARALGRRLYADELGPNFPYFWGYRDQFTLRVLDNTDGAGRWCDDISTQTIEDCPSRLRLALDDAVVELSHDYGPDPVKWRWGDAHKAIHAQQPFGAFPVIGRFFNREIEMDGGPFTLLNATNDMASNRPYAAIHGAGYRGIYDVAEPDNSLYIVSTGESGNMFSSHYDDLMGLWASGAYIAIPTQPKAIEAETKNRLTLQPVVSPTNR